MAVIATIVVVVFFGFFVGTLSRTYKKQRSRLINLVSSDIAMTIENIKTYGLEKNGWRNNLPSFLGWETATLRINKDFVLVTGCTKYAGLFKFELQPLVLAMDVPGVMSRLAFDRVYKPHDIRQMNSGRNLVLTIKPSGSFGQIQINLEFVNIGATKLEELLTITRWRG